MFFLTRKMDQIIIRTIRDLVCESLKVDVCSNKSGLCNICQVITLITTKNLSNGCLTKIPNYQSFFLYKWWPESVAQLSNETNLKITGVVSKLLIVSTFVLDNVGLGRLGRTGTADNTRSVLTSPQLGVADQPQSGCHLELTGNNRFYILYFSSENLIIAVKITAHFTPGLGLI